MSTKPRWSQRESFSKGTENYTVGTIAGKAIHYVIHVNLGAIKGTIATVIGKPPPDVHIWIDTGTAPGFIKFEGPLDTDGPVVQILLSRPATFRNHVVQKQ